MSNQTTPVTKDTQFFLFKIDSNKSTVSSTDTPLFFNGVVTSMATLVEAKSLINFKDNKP